MPNADWMAEFSDREELSLVDITFPASHDAGLQEAQGGFTGYTKVASKSDTICQYFDIAGQLEVGSRAFDLRIARRKGVLRTFHGEGNPAALMGGGWGQDARSIFEQTDRFLRDHPGEIVILRISHTDEKDGVHNLVRACIRQMRLVTCGPRNLALEPLPNLRGKALVIFDSKALKHTKPYQGLHRLAKYDAETGFSGEGLPICGKYAGQFAGTLTGNQKMREMTQYALNYGNAHGGHRRTLGRHDHLFMVYWQLAWNVKSKTINKKGDRDPDLRKLDDDRGTHYNIDYLFNCHRGKANMYHVTWNPKIGKKTKVSSVITAEKRMIYRPNWINLDFVCDEICDKVIEFNREFLPPEL